MSDELPEGWAARTIGAVVEFRYGKGLPESARKAGPVPVYGSNGVVGSHTEAVTSGPSIIIGRKGSVGVVHYCEQAAWPIDTTYFVSAFGPFDARFLAHQLRFLQLGQHESSTAIPGLSREDAYAQSLCVPPFAEQRRIVAKVEALLEQVRHAKDRLDRVPLILKRFRQSVLAAACSGQLTEAWRVANPDRLAPVRPVANRVARTRRQGANISKDGELLIDEMPDLPDSWAYWRADEVVDSDTVVTYGIVLPGPEHPGGVPYVRQQDIVDGGILVNELRHTTSAIAAKHARSTLRAGDVLLCIIRNLRVAMVPKGLDGANITQGMVRLRPGQHVRGDFLAAYLACPAAQGWMKARYFGMDMPRINVEDARAIPIALPPMDEQAEIMRRVDALFLLEEKVRGRLAASINRAGALPQAILSKAFAGELVPTEADLARAEGRDYETALQLLQRTKTVDSNGSLPEPRKRPKRLRVNNNALRAPGAGQGRSR